MEETLKKFLFNPTVGKLVTAIIGILILLAIIRFFQRSLSRYIKDVDTRYRARKFVTFIGYVAVILFLTTVYSDKLGGLTVAFGVAGAGIAFALQEVIASIAGWVAISFAGFYNPGDRVQLGGIKGDVIDISILRTTLMEVGEWVKGDLYSGRVVRVANSFVFKEPVFNYSGDFPFLWDEITVPVKYGCDHRLARAILETSANEIVGNFVESAKAAWKKMVQIYLIEDATVEPTVTLIANDNWMEFTVRYVVDYKKRRGTKDKLFTRILDEFEKTEGKVTIASMTVQLVETPVFDVRVTNKADDSNP
jgi:small-conductance mechanosensitive channel